MAKKRIKKPADVAAAVEAGQLTDEGRHKALSMGQRLVPQLRAVATDIDRVWSQDPASVLALSLLAAIGAPGDLVPDLMAAMEVAPEGSEILGLLADVLATTGTTGVDAVLARMQAPVQPALAEGLALVLAASADPRTDDALRSLLATAPLHAGPPIATRQDPGFLPELEAHLPTLQVPAAATPDQLSRIHGYLLACRALGSDSPRLIMIQLALTDRARDLATRVRDDLRGMEALDQLD